MLFRSMDEPVHLAMIFYLPRGKTVIRAEPTTRPDLSKLVRAVEDALTGVIYADDAQVVSEYTEKHYADNPRQSGCEIRVGVYA